MKRMFKSFIAVMLLISMIGSLAACGGEEKKEEISKNEATAGEETKKAEEIDQETVIEPITLTVFGGETEKTFLKGVQSDPVAKDIEAKLGITLDVVGQSTDPEVAKIMVATGDIPDVVQLNKDLMLTLIENGQLLPLDDLIETNGPDIKANANLAAGYSKTFNSMDSGMTYSIPGQVDPHGKVLNLVAPYIRWDYYSELGYPEVNNYDQLLDVVAQILENHPTNEDGQKNYGFSMWFDWDTFAFGMLPGYQSGIQQMDPGLGWDMFNREIIDWVGDDNSFMWEGVRFWNKANRMGLLDPDALTQKYDQALEKGSQNRIICEITQWHQGNTNNNLETAGYAGRGMQALAPFEGTDGYVGGWVSPIGNVDRAWAISANCENPERAMDFINYMYSIEGALTMYNGQEGESWVMEDGTYKLTDSFLEARKNDENYVLTTGARKYNTWPGLGSTFRLASGQTIELLQDTAIERETYLQVDKDYCDYYGIDTKGEVVGLTAKRFMSEELVSKFTTQAPDEIKVVTEQLRAYYIKELPKMVLAETDEELNEMIGELQSTLYDMGLKENQQWYIDDFENAKSIEAEFLKSVE